MPLVIHANCVEAIVRRKGWPHDLSNIYESAEIERVRAVDLLRSAAAEIAAAVERLQNFGLHKDTAPLAVDERARIEYVPLGQAADRCIALLLEKHSDPSLIRQWRERNRLGLREFSVKAPSDAGCQEREREGSLLK